MAECSFEGCTSTKRGARGWCNGHYLQFGRGEELRPLKRQRDRGSPGKSRLNYHGYRVRYFPEHGRSQSNGDVLEHILVMETKLGRPLLSGENVHHINGKRDDNRPENLELWVTSQPAGQRPQDLVAWAQTILDRYENLETK